MLVFVFCVYCICRLCFCFCFFKQKTAYEMRISDWSSDVCSSDLASFEDALAKAAQAIAAVKQSAGPGAVAVLGSPMATNEEAFVLAGLARADRKRVVEGKSLSVRVEFGGSRIINKKTSRCMSTHKRSNSCLLTVFLFLAIR